MCFDFIGMQQMYLSLARGDAGPLAEALRDRPAAAEGRALGHVRAQPRRAHPRQAVRGPAQGGLRRVRPPTRTCSSTAAACAGGCPRCSTATSAGSGWSTACSSPCPARPVLFYGEEIGMGENLKAEGRLAVRMPMQWTAEPGGGFSTADPSTFPEPLAEGAFGPRARQRPRPVARPRLAAVVLPPPHRLLPGVPGAGVGHGRGGRPRPGGRVGARAPRRRRRRHRRRPAQLRRDRKATAPLPLTDLAGPRALRRARRHPQAVRVAEDATLDVSLPPYGFRWLRSTPTTA